MSISTNTQEVWQGQEESASISCFAKAREEFEDLISWAQQSTGTLSEVEEVVGQRGRAVMRHLVQGHLDLRALREEKMAFVEGADGVSRRQRRRDQTRTIGTLFGDVEASRIRYETKEESAGSLCPLDGELNLPGQKYSHQVAKRVAHSATMGSFESTIETLEQTSGISVPKRQVEELVQKSAVDFAGFYAQRPVDEIRESWTESTLTVLTTDGKGIKVYPEDLRQQTRNKLDKELGDRLYFRKRMAQVASVYHIEPYRRTAKSVVDALMGSSGRLPGRKSKRPKPKDKRVWASIVDDAEEVIDTMVEEARRRDPGIRTTWVAVVDGAEHQIEVLEDAARARGLDLVIICDIMHVLGYLWEAAKALMGDDNNKQRKWVAKRLGALLLGQVSQVAAGIRRAKTMRRRRLKKAQRKVLDRCADYLLNHKYYLRYDHYLAQGFPIASGVIEGSVRHLVNDRMDITGAHWRLPSAEAVLRLRALRSSGDFEAYWAFHEQCELQRNHLNNYAGGILPRSQALPQNQDRRPLLRLVA